MENTTLLDDTTLLEDTLRIDRRFGTVVREGRWMLPAVVSVSLAAADVRLDLTEAVTGADTVRLEVDLGVGSELVLVVPADVQVVAENLDARFGDYEDSARRDPSAPVRLRVEIFGRLRGGADLVVRSPKRNFDQWLRPGRAS